MKNDVSVNALVMTAGALAGQQGLELVVDEKASTFSTNGRQLVMPPVERLQARFPDPANLSAYGLFVALIASNVKGGESVSVTQPGGLTSTGSIAGQVLADTATRVLNRQQNIPPTIEMDPGARMFITVARDMALTPVASNCK